MVSQGAPRRQGPSPPPGNQCRLFAVGRATAALHASGGRVCRCLPTWGLTMLSTILVVLLILLLLGAIPSWPYSRGWGYGPSGILGVVLIIVLILALTGRV